MLVGLHEELQGKEHSRRCTTMDAQWVARLVAVFCMQDSHIASSAVRFSLSIHLHSDQGRSLQDILELLSPCRRGDESISLHIMSCGLAVLFVRIDPAG
jgi:hypothetical protein